MSIGRPRSDSEWTPERISAVSKSLALLIVGGAAVGLFAVAAQMYYIAAAIGAMALVLLIAWRFESVLVVYVLVAFVPWGQTPDIAVGGSGIGKGLYVSQAMLGFLLLIWAIRYLFGALPKNRLGTGFYVPLGLYLAYSVLNIVHSYIFWNPHVDNMYQYPHVNAIEVGLRVLSAGALVMMATTASSKTWLRWMTFSIMTPGLFNLFNSATGSHIPLFAPWWPLVSLLPIGYCFAVVLDPGRSVAKRLLCAAVVATGIVVALVVGVAWVSGWLGLLLCLTTITFFRSRKLFVAGLAVVLIAAVLSASWISTSIVETSKTEGDYDRFALLAGAWKYATHFPLGVGLGNYRTYNTYYFGELWGTTTYTSAHGTYSQHLSEMGIPGLVLLLAILVGGFQWTLRNYREITDPLSETFLLATLGQIAGIAGAAFIGDYIFPTYHNGGLTTFSATVYSWLYWGLAISHVRLARTEGNGPDDIDS